MNIKFKHDLPLEETMVFEDVYSSELKIDLLYKRKLKESGAEFIYVTDADSGDLIGETYFIEIEKLDEHLPGLSDWANKNAVYVYSTTILPQYQNKGYGKILKAYFLGYIKQNYNYALGHAKENSSIAINKMFEAVIINEEKNWQDSGETFYFYKIEI